MFVPGAPLPQIVISHAADVQSGFDLIKYLTKDIGPVFLASVGTLLVTLYSQKWLLDKQTEERREELARLNDLEKAEHEKATLKVQMNYAMLVDQYVLILRSGLRLTASYHGARAFIRSVSGVSEAVSDIKAQVLDYVPGKTLGLINFRNTVDATRDAGLEILRPFWSGNLQPNQFHVSNGGQWSASRRFVNLMERAVADFERFQSDPISLLAPEEIEMTVEPSEKRPAADGKADSDQSLGGPAPC